jgi:hypothetical protein
VHPFILISISFSLFVQGFCIANVPVNAVDADAVDVDASHTDASHADAVNSCISVSKIQIDGFWHCQLFLVSSLVCRAKPSLSFQF